MRVSPVQVRVSPLKNADFGRRFALLVSFGGRKAADLGGLTLPDWIQHVLQGLAIAVVAAVVTVRLAIGRFRQERWWERRVDAYTAVLDALHRVERYWSQEVTRHMQAAKSERSESDLQKIHDAYAEIDKATDLSCLFMSDEAAACLNKLDHDMDRVIPTRPGFRRTNSALAGQTRPRPVRWAASQATVRRASAVATLRIPRRAVAPSCERRDGRH